MLAKEKNDILIAHMNLIVPEFVKSQLEGSNLVYTPKALAPEFMAQQPKAAPPAPPRQLPKSAEPSSPPLDPSPKAASDTSQNPWVVLTEKGETGPFSFPDAITTILQTREEKVLIKNKRTEHILQKEYLLKEFKNFAQQLERHLFDSAKKFQVPQQTTIEEIIVKERQGDSRNRLEIDSNQIFEGKAESMLKKGSGSTMPTANTGANPYMSNSAYTTAFEGRADDMFLPDQEYLPPRPRKPPTAPQFGAQRSPTNQQPSAPTMPGYPKIGQARLQEDSYSNISQEEEDEESFPSGQRSARQEKSYSQNPLSVMLEDYKVQNINLEEVFSFCEGASQFFSKIKQDNKKFYGGERADADAWASGIPLEEKALIAPLPPKPPQQRPPAPSGHFYEGRTYMSGDLKNAPSSVPQMNFSNLVDNQKINVRSSIEQRNPYAQLPYEHQLTSEQEKFRRKNEKPSYQTFKDYANPQDYYPPGRMHNYVSEENFDEPSLESYHSDSARDSRGNMYPPEFDRIKVPQSNARGQTKRIMPPSNSPDDFDVGHPPSKPPGPYVGYQSQKNLSVKNQDTSNPYMINQYEMSNLDSQNPHPFRSQTFGPQDPFMADPDSRYKNKPKPTGNMPPANRNKNSQKVYSKRN